MIVEEERRRMLQQNVDRLVGHIPKGVLSQVSSCLPPSPQLACTQGDLEMLGGRLKTIYREEPRDGLLELERGLAGPSSTLT